MGIDVGESARAGLLVIICREGIFSPSLLSCQVHTSGKCKAVDKSTRFHPVPSRNHVNIFAIIKTPYNISYHLPPKLPP